MIKKPAQSDELKKVVMAVPIRISVYDLFAIFNFGSQIIASQEAMTIAATAANDNPRIRLAGL
jgi:hypothetical protein